MSDESPIERALAALFFAVCVIVIITAPTWAPWVDSLGDEHAIADAHFRVWSNLREDPSIDSRRHMVDVGRCE